MRGSMFPRDTRPKDVRPMKRSKSVQLGLLAAAAGGVLAGCSEPVQAPAPLTQIQQCVDAQGKVLPESECEKRGTAANTAGGHGMAPFWIYHMGMPFRVGQTVPNAGLYSSPSPGVPTMRGGAALNAGVNVPGKTGTVRGGFGSSATGRAVYS